MRRDLRKDERGLTDATGGPAVRLRRVRQDASEEPAARKFNWGRSSDHLLLLLLTGLLVAIIINDAGGLGVQHCQAKTHWRPAKPSSMYVVL